MHPDSGNTGTIRVVLAARRTPFRGRLRRQIESEPRVEVVGEAMDVSAARALTNRLHPNILLIESPLNRDLGNLSSSECGTNTAVVVLVATIEIHDLVEAFELGARGVILKSSFPQTWGSSIQAILAGRYWIGDESVAALIQAARQSLLCLTQASLRERGLTSRELEIAEKVAAGFSNKVLGRELSISERTVKHHLTSIYRKLKVSSRLELAVLVREKSASDGLNWRIDLKTSSKSSQQTLAGESAHGAKATEVARTIRHDHVWVPQTE